MNPNVQLMIKIVKHPENNIVMSFPFPSNRVVAITVLRTGIF
jgi:hypothetical protein